MYVVVEHFIIFSRIYIYNWLRDHTSWAQVELKWRLKVFSRTFDLWFWNSPYRGTFLFLNSKTYLVHVINYEWSSEWSRSVNFSLRKFIFPTVTTGKDVVNVYYVMGFRSSYFTCIAHLYLYYTLLVLHTYASYIRHWCIFSH